MNDEGAYAYLVIALCYDRHDKDLYFYHAIEMKGSACYEQKMDGAF